MPKKEIGVIGLGKFGMQLAVTLSELGHRVVGLDKSQAVVQKAGEVLAAAYAGDATDRVVLDQLRFQDFDCVAISMSAFMESSILAVLNLQDLKVKHIIAKASSPQHKMVLTRLGVDRVIQPEVELGIQTAYSIHTPGILDVLPIGGGSLLQTVTVAAWEGKTLAELALPSRHQVMVVARKSSGDDDFSFVPAADIPLQKGDELILIGARENVLGVKP